MADKLPILVDRSGAHVNVLLGTVLVDTRGRRCLSRATWGLLLTGEHFQTIEAVVQAWVGSSPSDLEGAG